MTTALIPAPERSLARAHDQALPAYLSADEAHALISAATGPRDRMLLATLWATGGRVSEVLALRRCDLDPIGRSVRLRNLKQRSARAEKIVYLSDAFALELLAYCEAEGIRGAGLLFPSRTGAPLDRFRAWRIVRAAAIAAGIVGPSGRPAHVHQLRHGRAVHLLRNGVPLPAVQDQLGHSSILTTLVYTKLSARDLKEIVGRVEV